MCNAESAAYQQLLNTTSSSFSLTALSTDEVDSDDDVVKNILPRRPGPVSTPRQTAAAAAAADVQTDSQEVSRQPITASASVNALSNSPKDTDIREKRFVSSSSSSSNHIALVE